MIDRDYDDISHESTSERDRRQKKRLPKPLLRLLVILAAIVIVVVVVVVVARSVINSGQAADYQRYMTSLADILARSDEVGDGLLELLENPGDTNRTQIQVQLDKFVAECEALETEAKELGAPKDLIEQSIHQMFLLVMSFRQIGVSDLKPALMNALDVQETDVAVEQISHALAYLVNSDFLYDEVFVTKATAILQSKSLSGVTVPSTDFISDEDITSAAKVLDMLAGLKSTGDRQAIHGVALVKVVAMPDNKEIKAGGTYNLTQTSDLEFIVTVENQGNMEERDVAVLITLQVGTADPQRVTVEIPLIKPKAEATAKVKDLDPSAYGEQATLRIKAGPVPNEKYTENNSIKATVIFKL